MLINFDEYLKKKSVQQKIDKLAKKYKSKKVALYGAGTMCASLLENYNLKDLDIVGIGDYAYENNKVNEYFGYKTFKPSELLQQDVAVIIITVYDDENVRAYLKQKIKEEKIKNIKIETLVEMNLMEYIKYLLASM